MERIEPDFSTLPEGFQPLGYGGTFDHENLDIDGEIAWYFSDQWWTEPLTFFRGFKKGSKLKNDGFYSHQFFAYKPPNYEAKKLTTSHEPFHYLYRTGAAFIELGEALQKSADTTLAELVTCARKCGMEITVLVHAEETEEEPNATLDD